MKMAQAIETAFGVAADYNIITVRQVQVLLVVARSRGAPRHKDVVAETKLPPPTVVRIMDTLIELGLVARSRESAKTPGGRSVFYAITPEGAKAAAEIAGTLAPRDAMTEADFAKRFVDHVTLHGGGAHGLKSMSEARIYASGIAKAWHQARGDRTPEQCADTELALLRSRLSAQGAQRHAG